MEIKYEHDAESKTLTRTTTHVVKNRDETGKELEEVLFTRETTDVFAGKDSRDRQIKMLKEEEERAKQAVNNLKAQIKIVGEYAEDEELIKLEEQLKKLQEGSKKKQLSDNLEKSEKHLKDLRDELNKVKMVVPEAERLK